MELILTGATGFIAKALVPALLAQGHRVSAWVRDKERAQTLLPAKVHCFESLAKGVKKRPDAVINLAGAPILDKRWTTGYKRILRTSRIELTKTLIAYLREQDFIPERFISASAVGFYGTGCGVLPVVESKPAGDDFAAQLCQDWEAAASSIQADGSRVIHLRTGLVLGAGGGVLARLLPVYKMGLGGPVGTGQQPFPWIARTDFVRLVQFLLQNAEASGAYNATAPQLVSQGSFASELARYLHRPAVLRTPAFALRALLGEGAQLLLTGQAAVPERVLEAGFEFSKPCLKEALEEALGSV